MKSFDEVTVERYKLGLAIGMRVGQSSSFAFCCRVIPACQLTLNALILTDTLSPGQRNRLQSVPSSPSPPLTEAGF
jgi:hypothetical protein